MLGTPLSVWRGLGPQEHTGPDYPVRPFDIDVDVLAPLEIAALVVLGLGTAASVLLAAAGGTRAGGVAILSIPLAVAAEALLTYGWWITTTGAPEANANIGAGIVYAFFPLVVAGLVAGSVLLDRALLRRPTHRFVWPLLAGLIVALYVVPQALSFR